MKKYKVEIKTIVTYKLERKALSKDKLENAIAENLVDVIAGQAGNLSLYDLEIVEIGEGS